MIRLEPVLELDDFTFLHLSGDLSPTDLNAFLRRWAEYNQGDELSALLHTEDDMTLLPGGVRATRPSGAAVTPGCCCGLDEWRSWIGLLDREPIWMGHDPGVVQKFVGDKVHLSQEGGELTLKLPLRDIPALVAQVRTDLLGLLALVEAHAGPEYAAVLDRDLTITDPLP